MSELEKNCQVVVPIDSLTDILTGVGFQPKELIDEPITYCMIL